MSEYEKSEMEPDTYRIEWELQVLICRNCYGDVTTLVDNYWLIDNNQQIICSLEIIEYLSRDKEIVIYSNNKVVRDNLSVECPTAKGMTFVIQ